MSNTGNNTLFIDSVNPATISLGLGDDRYVLSGSNLTANQTVTIDDSQGANTLQLVGGLAIASSQVFNNAIQLTLNNGAKVNVLNASTFKFLTGGDAFNGTGGLSQTFSQFVTVALGSTVPAAGAAASNVGPVTLVNPSAVAVPTFTVAAPASVGEGSSATFTVSLSAAQAAATTVTYTLAGTGGATLGTDTGVNVPAGNTGTLTFAPGEITKTVVVPFIQDSINETAGEGVSLTLSAPSTGAVLSATAATATTAIAEVPVTFTLTGAADVLENANATYTITANRNVDADTVVAFAVQPGNATAADQGTTTTNLNDFGAGAFNPFNVTIKAGTSTATYTVSASNDGKTELPETFTVTGSVAGAVVASKTTTLLDGTGVNAGQTFTLTVNQDSGSNFTGGSGNDAYVAAAAQDGNGKLINTLQSVDSLNGGDGVNTLTATLAEAGEVAPTLTKIGSVDVRFADKAAILNISNATGLTDVTVANSTTAGTLKDVGALANLTIKNQNQGLSLDGAAASATTLKLNLDTVGTSTAPITLNLGATKAAAATTGTITANNAYVKVDSTSADVLTTATIAATGTNALTFTDSAATLTKVTVTGAGSLDLTGAALAKVTTFDGSASKGAIKAELTEATKVVTITTGDGNDVIDADAVATAQSSANLGAGNDTLLTGDNLAAFTKGVNGGDGIDIISITDGSKLDATTSPYITSFETLDVSGGKGNYDVSLNSFATVQIDEAIAGVLAGDVDFKNAADTFTLTIASKAKDADFDVVKNITVTGKDYTGTTAKATAETFTLVANLNDGDKDNTAEGNIDAQTVTVAGVENIAITANVTTLDGGTDALVASKSTLTAKIVATEAEALTIKGDASVNLSGATTIGVLTKVDASASTGNMTIDLKTHAISVAYTGSQGVDTYTGTAKGDTLYTGKGADVIDLTASAAGGRDTFVLKAATDSQLTDTSKDGKITLAADTGFDAITKFITGGGLTADRIDLTNFGFTLSQRGVENVNAKVTGTTDLTKVVDLFSSVAGDRGVAFSDLGAGGNTYVFVDVNKDGDFTAAADIVIQLAGVTSISEVDINF